MPIPEKKGWLRRVTLFLLILSGIVALHWANGTFHSEFGRYPDEGMHYVTGLMIRDYVTSGAPPKAMEFALNYYLHYPKVGLGNWPPVFPIIQTAWTLVAGASRVSMIVMMCVLLAILANVVFAELEQRFGKWLAILAVVLVVASPLTQAQTAMVMAEIPLALLSLLAILALTRFLKSTRWADSLAFGLLTTAAILTKGNGWVLVLTAPVAIVLSGEWRKLFHPRFIAGCAVIAGVCLPYQYVTRNILSQGWNQLEGGPTPQYLINSLWLHVKFITQILGVPMTLIAVAGLIGFAIVPLIRRQAESYWVVMASYAIMILLFHSMVPTSIEPRKIYQIAPVLSLFVAAGVVWISKVRKSVPMSAWCAAAAAIFFAGSFTMVKAYTPGLPPVVELIQSKNETTNAAILFSSNPIYTDLEAAFISEWIERERRVDTYLVRATKLLAHPGMENGVEYPPLYKTPDEVDAVLNAVPVAYVVLHTVKADKSYPHHELLRAALTRHPDQWEKIHQSQAITEGVTNEILVYRSRKAWQGVPVKLSIDLTRKIGSTVETGK